MILIMWQVIKGMVCIHNPQKINAGTAVNIYAMSGATMCTIVSAIQPRKYIHGTHIFTNIKRARVRLLHKRECVCVWARERAWRASDLYGRGGGFSPRSQEHVKLLCMA